MENDRGILPVSLGIFPVIQNRLLSLIILAATLPSMVIGAFSLYLGYQLLSVAETVGIKRTVWQEIGQVGVIIFVTYVLSLIFVFLLGLLFSHRLVGPLDRLQDELDSMLDKKQIQLLRVRQNDYLKPFFETLNKVLVNLAWENKPKDSD